MTHIRDNTGIKDSNNGDGGFMKIYGKTKDALSERQGLEVDMRGV